MNKKYLVMGKWVDKQSGESKISISLVNEGVSKLGHEYQIVNSDDKMVISGNYSVGTLLDSVTSFNVPSASKTPSTSVPAAKK